MNTVINTLPFFFQSHTTSNNGGFPQTLPFDLYFDDNLEMFRQKSTTKLSEVLNNIYINGSLVDGSVSSESGKVYIEKIVNYIFEHFDFKNDSNILEIGYGSGVILKELKQKGVQNLSGIEPGNHKKIDGLEGVNLVHDFFPSVHITNKFDLIYSLLVLEHIEDPLTYLNNLIEFLQPDGKIIIGVPNCEPYILEGDLSIFIHEHYSYFTRTSIMNLVNKTSLKIEDIAVIEGALIVTISKNGVCFNNSQNNFNQLTFYERIDKHIEKLKQLFQKYNQNEIAIFAPTRAINSLFLTNYTSVRLIDDNSEMHNKYLPTLLSYVESYEQLVANPPKCLLIFSRTFGERIKQKCIANKHLANTYVLTLNDLDRN